MPHGGRRKGAGRKRQLRNIDREEIGETNEMSDFKAGSYFQSPDPGRKAGGEARNGGEVRAVGRIMC
jgi:hypothetical protein